MAGRDRTGAVPLLAFGAAAVAVVCCAGLPLVAGVLAGVSLVAVVGIGASGLLIVGALAAGLAMLRAHRRACRADRPREGTS